MKRIFLIPFLIAVMLLTWAVTDETLTLRFTDFAMGIAFRVTGSTLTIQNKAGSSKFMRISADKLTIGGNHDQD